MPNKYAVSSTHAIDLADGRPAANGDTVTLKDDEIKEPHNAALIESGVLVEQATRGAKGARKNGGDS